MLAREKIELDSKDCLCNRKKRVVLDWRKLTFSTKRKHCFIMVTFTGHHQSLSKSMMK